jgi:hypothetical protein
MARLSSCAGRSGQVCSVDGTLVDALAGVLVPEGSTCNGHHWVMAPPNRLGSVLACRCLIAPSEGHGQGPDHRRWRRRASGRDGAAARRDRRGRPRGLRPHQPGEGRLLPHCGQQRHRRAARHRRRHLGHACRSRPWAPASRSPCRHRFGRTTSTARALGRDAHGGSPRGPERPRRFRHRLAEPAGRPRARSSAPDRRRRRARRRPGG